MRGVKLRSTRVAPLPVVADGGRGTGQRWSPRRIGTRVRLLLAGFFALAMFALVPLPFGSAVTGPKAGANPGQVRIFEEAEYVGTGTLINRNWIVTAGHIFDAALDRYTFRFGGTNNRGDGISRANLRSFDRIVIHPTVPDLALLHFADPVSEDTAVARLATSNPFSRSGMSGVLFGWGDRNLDLVGTTLHYRRSRVIDIDPRANREVIKRNSPDVASTFGDASMFALASHVSAPGDSGGGFFRSGGLLAALHWGSGAYRRANASGEFYGPEFDVSWEIPLWPYASWIQSVIDGSGSSTKPSHDELKRRRLQEREADDDGASAMTGPPEVANDGCDPGDMSCYREPVEPSAVLIAFSTNQGTVLTRCAGNDEGDACTFDQNVYPKSSRPTLPLAPPPRTSLDAQTGRRDVVIWCKYKGSLTTGAPPYDLVRFSFTNTDAGELTPAYGWWDVSAAQIEEALDDPIDAADLDELAVCAG